MIAFCDKEIYVIHLDEVKASDLFSFFISDGRMTDIIVVLDGEEKFYGIITYERLLYRRENLIQTQKLKVGEDIWTEASQIFKEDKHIVYIPVFDQNDDLIYFCYQAIVENERYTKGVLDELYNDTSLLFINELYPKVQGVYIYDFNELAFRLYELLLKRGIPVVVNGDKWKLIAGIETKKLECPDFARMTVYTEGTPLVYEAKGFNDKVRFTLPNAWNFIFNIGAINHLMQHNEIKQVYRNMGIRTYICSIPKFTSLMNRSIDEEYRHMKCFRITNQSLDFKNPIVNEEVRKLYQMDYQELKTKLNLLDSESDQLSLRRNVKKYGTEDNIIYLIGPCIVAGIETFEEDTLLSRLYNIVKLYGLNYSVIGVCIPQMQSNNVKEIIESLSIKDTDIVILIGEEIIGLKDKFNLTYDIDVDLLDLFNTRNPEEAWFTNSPVHTTGIGNEAIANELIEKIIRPEVEKTDFSKPAKCLQRGRVLLNKQEKIELDIYLKNIQKYRFSGSNNSRIGSIIMNCNPITLGHLYLIEYASSQVDILYIFVVEEDRSFFRFEERFALVEKATAHIKNVQVIPSGKFILSNKTLPAYFTKDYQKDLIIDASEDIALFAEYIAPALDINVRFVGEEPLDFITNQYNMEMRRVLVNYGIQFVEIPRKEFSGEVISASRVRILLKERNFNEIQKIVPDATYQFLKYEFDLDRCK